MNWNDFHLLRPYWLLTLIPWALLLAAMFRQRLGRGNWVDVCDRELLPYILQERSAAVSQRPVWLAGVAGLLAITALAGPVWERLPTPVFRNVSGLVIALDLSRSMDAEDIRPSRLLRARYKIADILQQRRDGQTALLVYAGETFAVTPLTDDTETISSQLSALTTSIMPSQGSRADLALSKAVALLRQAGLRQGQILLVTDGVDMQKTLPVADKLQDYRLSVLGIGTVNGAPIKIEGGGFLKNQRGEIVVAKLHPEQLRRLAGAGGGIYRQITADSRDVDALSAFFDRHGLQTGKQQDNKLLLDNWRERSPWLLLLILPVAALAFRRGILGVALLLLLPLPRQSQAMNWQDLWQTPDQQAQHSFARQDYQQAAELFQAPRWKAAAQYKAGQFQQALKMLDNPHSSQDWYNKGNVHARLGQFQEAIAAYHKALQLDPDNDDARYNKELLERQRQKQQQKNQGQDEQEQQDKKSGQDKQEQDKQNQDQGQQAQQNQDGKDADRQSDNDGEADGKDAREQHRKDTGRDDGQQSSAAQRNAATEAPTEDAKQQEQGRQAEAPRAQQGALQQDETREANEQWLKRIPDDPAGLLRRKFKYQYSRMKNKNEESDAW